MRALPWTLSSRNKIHKLLLKIAHQNQTMTVNGGPESLDQVYSALRHNSDASEESILQAAGTAINIDETLTAPDELKIKLLYSRNMKSLINRIPQEILTKIFLCAIPRTSNCSLVSTPEYLYDSTSLGAIAISHVCQHWRAIALSTPLLWTRQIPKTLDALRMFLSRSCNIPIVLDICFFYDRSYPNEYVQLLFDQLPRARGLYLDLDLMIDEDGYHNVEHTWNFLHALQAMPPSLEHLHISAYRINDAEDLTTSDTIKWIPPDLKSNNRFPRLRQIFIHSIPVDWGCGLFRNLHTLTLINISQNPLSLRHFSAILSACPELEELTIHSVEWEDELSDTSSIQNEPVYLARLRLARVEIYQPIIVQKLLNRIAFSPEANVWINAYSLALDLHTTEMLVQAFDVALRRSQRPLERLGIFFEDADAGVYGSVCGSKGDATIQLRIV
jgi:hypothetical protein